MKKYTTILALLLLVLPVYATREAQPDLVIQNLRISRISNSQSPDGIPVVGASFVVLNRGNADAIGTITAGMVLMTKSGTSIGGIGIGCDFCTIKAGESLPFGGGISVYNLESGTYKIEVSVDKDGYISESNEKNNIKERIVQI